MRRINVHDTVRILEGKYAGEVVTVRMIDRRPWMGPGLFIIAQIPNRRGRNGANVFIRYRNCELVRQHPMNKSGRHRR